MILLKQIGIILAGLAAAGLMIFLGGWQMGVYLAQGQASAQERAAEPAVQLVSVAPPGEEVGDAYGRTVEFSGSYDPRLQELLPINGQPDRYRVLTGFRLDGGGAVAVVRGEVSGDQAPEPPAEQLTQHGIFLPTEADPGPDDPTAAPTAVELPALAQQWDFRLVNGYVNLSADDARAQSLEPAPAKLPKGDGRLRNGFYALQWWVFAAFAVGMSIRMARDFGREASLSEIDVSPVDDSDQQPEESADSLADRSR